MYDTQAVIMVTHLLWSIDGAMFNTFPALTYAFSQTLNQMGIPLPLNVIDGLVRQSLNHSIRSISERYRLDPQLVMERFDATYTAIDPAGQAPFPGVVEICQRVIDQGGYNIIITEHTEAEIESLLLTHGITHLIHETFTSHQGFRPLPDPQMVTAALERFSLPPAETLLICGRTIDVNAALGAGIRTCSIGEQHLPGASLHIGQLAQLIPLLGKRGNDEI